MTRNDTVLLYNFPPNVTAKTLALALGASSVKNLVWGTNGEVGVFAVAQLSTEGLAFRLLEGSPTNNGRSTGSDAAEPLRIRIGDKPLCVIPSPINIAHVVQRKPNKPGDKQDGGDRKKGPGGDRKERPARPAFTCNHCGEEGHKMRDCPTAPAPEPFLCNHCGEEGHKARECPTAPPAEPFLCNNCGLEGHKAKECPTVEKFTCRNCGEEGHKFKECPHPRMTLCRNCGKDGHMARDCPDGAGAEAAAAAAAEAEAAPAPPEPRALNGCKFCGSTEHLSRKCPNKDSAAAVTAPPPAKAVRVERPYVPAVVPQQQQYVAPAPVARRVGGGDGCKFCGSTDHLSRLCPEKKKGILFVPPAAPAAPAGDEAAPAAPIDSQLKVPSASACFFCGEEGHKTSACPKKDAQMRSSGGPSSFRAPMAPRAAVPNAAAASGNAVRRFLDDDDDDDKPFVPTRQAAPAAQPVVAQRGSGDGCKFCGSEAHLSRQCPTKKGGAAPQAVAPTAPAPAAAAAPSPNHQQQYQQQAPAQQQHYAAPVQPAPEPVRRGPPPGAPKDACKFCASMEHLSRQCPNKNKK